MEQGLKWDELRQFAVIVTKDFPFVVFPGSEKLDLGPAEPVAFCQSQQQAEALIASLWPGLGYWRKI
jgi:hypothetical protein